MRHGKNKDNAAVTITALSTVHISLVSKGLAGLACYKTNGQVKPINLFNNSGHKKVTISVTMPTTE